MQQVITVAVVAAVTALVATIIIINKSYLSYFFLGAPKCTLTVVPSEDPPCRVIIGSLCGPSCLSICHTEAASMLITRLTVKRGAIMAQLSFQARGVIVLLAASHVALVGANSAFPQQPQHPVCIWAGKVRKIN